MKRYDSLQRMMRATQPFSKEGEGGSHTDVFRFEREALVEALAPLAPGGRDDQGLGELAEHLSSRYLVKKGKIRYFSMALTGAKQNHIRRSSVSFAFGPAGYSLTPTFEKVILDAREAGRLVPYLGFGSPESFFAPDFVSWANQLGQVKGVPSNTGTFLSTVLPDAHRERSLYEVLRDDPYFHPHVESAAELLSFQQFIRRNPLSAEMQQKFARFFEGPITVGLRDTLRWLKGSRHPQMDWPTARGLIDKCFARHGHETFIPPEINYYSFDTDLSSEAVSALLGRNRAAARAFAAFVEDRLPGGVRESFVRQGPERIAFELLDFHHDYRLYDVEPYAGVLSLSSARLAARVACSVFLEVANLPEIDDRNHQVDRLPEFHTASHAWLASLSASDRAATLEALSDALVAWERRPRRQRKAVASFERIPRTFYTFQELATVAPAGWRFKGLNTMQALWEPQNRGFWDRYPELSSQLVVFFTLAYRHFADTGFVADLRPRDAGRDIFIYGIWGYLTENLLVVEEENDQGEVRARLAFVDNRDQFKEYRPEEDRLHPLGMAKHALRFIHPVVEPGMQRSVGIFLERVRRQEGGQERPTGAMALMEHGLDVARKVAKDTVDNAFVAAQATVDDFIDDAHAGARQSLRKLVKRVRRASKLRFGLEQA